jgi:hypothetical protein
LRVECGARESPPTFWPRKHARQVSRAAMDLKTKPCRRRDKPPARAGGDSDLGATSSGGAGRCARPHGIGARPNMIEPSVVDVLFYSTAPHRTRAPADGHADTASSGSLLARSTSEVSSTLRSASSAKTAPRRSGTGGTCSRVADPAVAVATRVRAAPTQVMLVFRRAGRTSLGTCSGALELAPSFHAGNLKSRCRRARLDGGGRTVIYSAVIPSRSAIWAARTAHHQAADRLAQE